MDEEYIVSLAEPCSRDGLLTYKDFEQIFGDAFELREQYLICEILYESGIELVDELPFAENTDNVPQTIEQHTV